MKKLVDVRWIVIHTEGAPGGAYGTAESIRRYHVQERGWPDIGYHAVIERHGVAKPGRSEAFQGAGVEGFNEHALHACVAGNGDLAPWTLVQLKALASQVVAWMRKYDVSLANVLGHREAADRPDVPDTTKHCPGKRVSMRVVREAVAAELARQIQPKPLPGERRWSESLGEWIVLARYASDTDWSYVTEKQLATNGYKAGAKWSAMPLQPKTEV